MKFLSRYTIDEVLWRTSMISKSRFLNVGVILVRPMKHDPFLAVTQPSHFVVQAYKLTVPHYISLPEAILLESRVDVAAPT